MRLRAVLAVVLQALLLDRERAGRNSGLPGSTVSGCHQTPERSGLPSEGARRGAGRRMWLFVSAVILKRSSPSVLSCVVSPRRMSS